MVSFSGFSGGKPTGIVEGFFRFFHIKMIPDAGKPGFVVFF